MRVAPLSLCLILVVCSDAFALTPVWGCKELHPQLFGGSPQQAVSAVVRGEITEGCKLEALSQFAATPSAPAGAAAVTTLLRHRDAYLRHVAAEALFAYRDDARPALRQLTRALDDAVASVRAHAAYALGGIRPRSPKTTQRLIDKLSDPSDQVTAASAFALAHAGPLPERALDPLLALLPKMNFIGVRSHDVIRAIGHVQSPRAIAELLRLVDDARDGTSRHAMMALCDIPLQALPALTDRQARATSKEARDILAQGILLCRDTLRLTADDSDAKIATAVRGLQHVSQVRRMDAIRALERLVPALAVDLFDSGATAEWRLGEAVMSDQHPHVRELAEKVLQKITARRASYWAAH